MDRSSAIGNDTLREVPHLSNEGHRQECGGHDPTKKICCVVEAFDKVCMYRLLRTVCNASCLEMDSEYIEKRREIAVLNSQILAHRILGFGATSTKKQRKPTGKTSQGIQEKHQLPERKSAEYHSSSVAPDFHPIFFPLCGEPVAQFLTLPRQPITKFLPLMCCCCCFHMLQVAACNAERLPSCCFAPSHRLVFS